MGTTLLVPPAEKAPEAAPGKRGPTAPRTVIHLIGSNFYGGPEKQIVEHCTRLDPERWRAVVGSFREGRDRVDVVEAARLRGLPVFLVDTRSPFSPGSVLQLLSRIRQYRADLVVAHGYKSTAVGFMARGLKRVPVIPFVRGYTAETARVRFYEKVDRHLLKRFFPRIACVSESTRRLLVDHGVDADRIRAVHNAVEIRDGIAPADLRAEFGIPTASPVLVAAGRLSAEKGHRFLLEALVRMNSGAPPHAVILGEGRERERLHGLARALEISHRVHFAGFRHDPLPWLAAADVVVNPSLTEGLPNVVLEAHSLGMPVVATDVGGVGELIDHGRTGWLVKSGDPDALARAVLEALADRARARAVAEAGRDRVRESFSFQVQADRLMTLYDDVVGS